MDAAPVAPALKPRRGGRWTTEQRAAAFAAYFRTGSRRQARKLTGVPQRTLSMWLRDARLAEERQAVQAGLLRSVEADAERRGVELVEATREAILVCRRALRGSPDARSASSLLMSLTRAREAEDRIQRLDQGSATEISGITLSPEDREAFLAWHEERQALATRSDEELQERFVQQIVEHAQVPGRLRDVLWGRFVRALADEPAAVTWLLRDDLALARRLQSAVDQAVRVAEEQSHIGSPLEIAVVPEGEWH